YLTATLLATEMSVFVISATVNTVLFPAPDTKLLLEKYMRSRLPPDGTNAAASLTNINPMSIDTPNSSPLTCERIRSLLFRSLPHPLRVSPRPPRGLGAQRYHPP